MATPTPRAQMKSPLVASYLPRRTLLSILLLPASCGDGGWRPATSRRRRAAGSGTGRQTMKSPAPAIRGCSPGQKPPR